MNLSPPSPEELAAIRAKFSYRYPQTGTLTVLGDRGVPVKLTLVIGNPKGACVLPPGEKATSVWADAISAGLRLGGAVASEVAQECLLYPDLATWGEWVARWPGLPTSLSGKAIADKINGLAVVTPMVGEDAPEAIAAALAANPSASWFYLKGKSEQFAVVINPPSDPVFRLSHEEMGKGGEDRWKAMKELLAAQVCACVQLPSGAQRSLPELYTRWPALAVHLVVEVERIAGGLVEAELGE